jgi:hypothetical protein
MTLILLYHANNSWLCNFSTHGDKTCGNLRPCSWPRRRLHPPPPHWCYQLTQVITFMMPGRILRLIPGISSLALKLPPHDCPDFAAHCLFSSPLQSATQFFSSAISSLLRKNVSDPCHRFRWFHQHGLIVSLRLEPRCSLQVRCFDFLKN